MVVGIDVYHDTGPGGRRSVAGIVATINASFTKHYSRATFQEVRSTFFGRLGKDSMFIEFHPSRKARSWSASCVT